MEEIILFNVNHHKNNSKNQNNLFSENNDDNIFNSFGYQNLEASEKLEMEFRLLAFIYPNIQQNYIKVIKRKIFGCKRFIR